MNTESEKQTIKAKQKELDSSQMKKSEPKPALNFLLISAGSMFTSMVVAGFLVGYVFDELLDTKPIFLLSCGVLGFVGGILKVHRLLSKMDLMYESTEVSNSATESKEVNK